MNASVSTKRVRQMFNRKSITLDRVVVETGISHWYLKELLDGERTEMAILHAYTLATFFDASLDWLFGRVSDITVNGVAEPSMSICKEFLEEDPRPYDDKLNFLYAVSLGTKVRFDYILGRDNRRELTEAV